MGFEARDVGASMDSALIGAAGWSTKTSGFGRSFEASAAA